MMPRKNFILMLGVVSLSLVAFVLLVHSLNTRAIGEERENVQATPFAENQMVGQDQVYSNIPPENQPSEDRWIPLASDPQDVGNEEDDIKTLYYQVYSGILYFKVVHYGNWVESRARDLIYLDIDQNASTGLSIRGIGAEICYEIKTMVNHTRVERYWSSGYEWEPYDYIDLPSVGNTYVVGKHLCFFCHDSLAPQVGTFDLFLYNEYYPHDYVPDTGHLTLDVCFCADPNADGVADIVDVVYLINYILKGGPGPQCN
jgi:hypothetical protein